MKAEYQRLVGNVFDLANEVNGNNFWQLLQYAAEVNIPIYLVKFGYRFDHDTFWSTGVMIAPNQKFRFLYGSFPASTNPEDVEQQIRRLVKNANDAGYNEFAVYECMYDNCEVADTLSGYSRYAVINIDKLVPAEFELEFKNISENIYESRVMQ